MVVKKKCKKCGLYTICSIAEKNPICPDCFEKESKKDVERITREQGQEDTD